MPNGLPAMFGADPLAYQQMRLGQQQLTAQNAMAMAPGIYAGPNVFAPQPAAPSPAGGPRPPMPGQASTPAPAPAPAQAPIPPYKAMPGTPAAGAGAPTAPVSLPPKPVSPQLATPPAGAPSATAPTPQQAPSAAAPAWAQPTFQPVDIATAEQQFYANPQLRQQAAARRDYLIQQGIPAATAESWVNQDVSKLWGMQASALQHQNDQYMKFQMERSGMVLKEIQNELANRRLDLQAQRDAATDERSKRMYDVEMKRLDLEGKRLEKALSGSGSNPSHAIALMSQENQQLKPIEQTQYSLSELQNLVDQVRNGNSAAAKQIPSFLAGLAPRVRMTNHLYSQSGAIGGIYERLANSLNQLTMGNQSPKVLNYIDKMVKQLNAQLDGARSNIVNRYKDVGKKFGYDDTLFNVSNPYDTSASTPAPAAPAPVAAPAAIPEGWSVKQTGGR